MEELAWNCKETWNNFRNKLHRNLEEIMRIFEVKICHGSTPKFHLALLAGSSEIRCRNWIFVLFLMKFPNARRYCCPNTFRVSMLGAKPPFSFLSFVKKQYFFVCSAGWSFTKFDYFLSYIFILRLLGKFWRIPSVLVANGARRREKEGKRKNCFHVW